MSKTIFRIEPVIDFKLIGISSHQKDYRLCWAINKHLGLELAKEKDLELNLKKSKENYHFSAYMCKTDDGSKEIFLLANRSGNNFLIPDLKNVDYFLQIYGPVSSNELKAMILDLKKINLVLMAYEVQVEDLKAKDNLFH